MLKRFIQPLFLGVVVLGISACGGAGLEEAPGLESSAPEAAEAQADEVGEVEQRVCSVGSYTGGCRDYGSGGYLDSNCSIPTPYMWSFWNCSQYQYGSGPTAQYYRQYCFDKQLYVCGSSKSVPPTARCQQNC